MATLDSIDRGRASESHPSPEKLAAFLGGTLKDEAEHVVIESHVAVCELCANAFDSIAVDDDLLQLLRACLKANDGSNMGGAESEPAGPDTESLSGVSLGKYKVAEMIGRGGMGVVYRAHDSVILRDVAVKVLPTSISQDATMMERLLSEARHAGSIAHPHVVTIYDMATDTGVGYVAMEFISGGSAADLLREHDALSWQEATRMIAQASAGVGAAHANGVIHRDIKPANLLLTADGTVKVADFGLSKASERDQTVTAAGTIAGTAHFMSPEQCRGSDVDARSDIYSLGATYFALLTGQPPFADMKQITQIMYAHCHAKVPDPSVHDGTIPAACTSIIHQAMQKKREERYQKTDDLRSDLERLLDGSGPQSSRSLWTSLSALPEGPSLIVLPFQNLSPDPEQEYFSDGITHEIISQLGRFRELHLIAGRTAFQYKDQPLDVRQLRSELQVQYVLEGTVRTMGNRMRITATLLDTESAKSVWRDQFDRDLGSSDVFEVQDEIAERVSSALAQPHGELQMAERARRMGLETTDAYDAVLRFYEYWHLEELELYWPVRQLLEEVVDTNPRYAQAVAALSLVYANGLRNHQLESGREDLDQAYVLAKRALELDPHSEMAHAALLTVHFHRGELREFSIAAQRAITAHPNHADLLADAGLFFICIGQYERGRALGEKALSLCPRPPGWYYSGLCLESLRQKDYESALNHALAMETASFWTPLFRAICSAYHGQHPEAASHLKEALETVPDLAAMLPEGLAMWNLTDELTAVLVEGARRAGLELDASGT